MDNILRVEGSGELAVCGYQIELNGSFKIEYSFQRKHNLAINFIPNNDSKESMAKLDMLIEDILNRKISPFELALKGITKNGQIIKADHLLIVHSKNSWDYSEVQIELIAQRNIHIGSCDKTSKVCFYISNLVFVGSAYSNHNEGRSTSLDRIPFSIFSNGEKINLEFKQIDNYKEIKKNLEKGTASGGLSAILTLKMESNNEIDLDVACKIADQILWLSSLASGQILRWICLEVSKDNQFVYKQLRDVIVENENYNGLPGCIPLNKIVHDGENLICVFSKFLECAFDQFKKIHESESCQALLEAIDTYCDSMLTSTLQTRAYFTAYAFEALIRGFLPEQEKSYMGIIKKDLGKVEAKKIRSNIKSFLESEVISALKKIQNEEINFAEEFQNRIDGNIDNLMRKPWKISIEALLKIYKVPYESKFLGKFVDSVRNPAIHANEIKHNEFSNTWLQGNKLLELLLLKILGYSGFYYDKLTDHWIKI